MEGGRCMTELYAISGLRIKEYEIQGGKIIDIVN